MAIIRNVMAWQNQPRRYDVFFCALGYEPRSTYVAQKQTIQASLRIAVGFDYLRVGAVYGNEKWFDENGYLSWMQGKGIDSPFVNDSEFEKLVDSVVAEIAQSPQKIASICIDISCFSTIRLASLLGTIAEKVKQKVVELDLLYAAGDGYSNRPEPMQIEVAGPVTDRYAGWTIDPNLPVVAIFGLGLEYEKAVGAFELLNPSDAFAFATLGTSRSLDRQLTEANRLFFPLIDEAKRFPFRIEHPMELYNRLRSLMTGALRVGRPVIVPMGPKLFAIAALLLAEEFRPDISVWRISTGRTGKAWNIVAKGPVSGYTVVLE